LAWTLMAVWAVVTTASVTLGVVDREAGDLGAALWVGYAVVGALVASRHPRNPVGWLLLAFALANSYVTAVSAYAHAGPHPGSVALLWSSRWGWYVWLSILLVFLPLAFPDGRLLSGHRRWITVLGIAAVSAAMVGAAFNSSAVAFSGSERNPLGVRGAAGTVFNGLETAGQVLLVLATVLTATSVVVRLRGSDGVERQQMKWFAWAAAMPAAGWTIALASTLSGPFETAGSVVGWVLFILGGVVVLPLATGIAIFRHRLYDIDVVIHKALVYGGLTATLLTTYVFSVLVLERLLSPLTSQSDLAVAGSTLAVAALFRPARRRIQKVVDRRFYRSRYDAVRTLDDFATRLRHEVDLETLRTDLRRTTEDVFQPDHVTLWMRP
jgi:hypothetical protein